MSELEAVAGALDDIVIGAGILGLAHAYHLSERGRRVLVLERHPRASGASIRNFGMLWPIGQPFGPLRALAKRSLKIWREVLDASGLPYSACGSLHLAHHEDEAQVLEEYAAQSLVQGQPVDLLTPAQAVYRSPILKLAELRAALWSPEETWVDSRAVIAGLPGWLARRGNVAFEFGCSATAVEPPHVHAGGRTWLAERVWICNGDDLDTLFPRELSGLGLVRCKLQMMRLAPPAAGWRLGTMLAGGLTLRHYAAFAGCPSLAALKQRIARETPWYDRYGIHVLVSQDLQGELIVGDSHEYGDAIDPFDKPRIDELILSHLRGFIDAPELKVASRWHGTYVKHPTEPIVVLRPRPGVTVVTSVGGAGMTLAFGVAESVVRHELGEDGDPAGTSSALSN